MAHKPERYWESESGVVVGGRKDIMRKEKTHFFFLQRLRPGVRLGEESVLDLFDFVARLDEMGLVAFVRRHLFWRRDGTPRGMSHAHAVLLFETDVVSEL